ncbi:MAG: tetratricopeptide repeat protein [Phycisphaerales bacterium]|nr:tetratricopeptide repeat protein [Phycisphaerales bacterium]
MTQLTPPQAFHEAQRLIRMGEYARASGLTGQLFQNIPDEPAIRGLHGIATARMGLLEKGLGLLTEACEKAADHKVRPFLLIEKAYVLRSLNRAGEALEAARAAGEAEPENQDAVASVVDALIDLGQFDEARAVLPGVTETEAPTIAAARARLALLSDRPDEGADALAKAIERVGIAAFELEIMLRLLGQLRERQGRYDDAWKAYRRAAKLRRTDYDPRAHRAMVNELIAGWTPAALSKIQRSDLDGSRVVLTLGLPGSGHDLVERIVARHSRGQGAGELLTLARIARAGMGAQQKSFRHIVARPNMLKGKQLRQGGQAYLAQLDELNLKSARVVDSNVLNVYLAGLAPLMLNGMHVVICVRDPAEAAFAWYTGIPGPQHPYAQDPGEQMDHAVDVMRLCDHWRGLFTSMGVHVHEFSFERFADAPEGEARLLIEGIGLEFEPACSQPHLAAKTRTAPSDLARLPASAWARRYSHFHGLLKPGFEMITARE